jgi:hypothetical protein
MSIEKKVKPENSSWRKVLLAFTTIAILGYLFARTGQYVVKVLNGPQYDERLIVYGDHTLNRVDFYDQEPVYFRNTKTLDVNGSQLGEIKWCFVSQDGKRNGCLFFWELGRNIDW